MTDAHPHRSSETSVPSGERICDWPGCEEHAGHRAPKGRDKLDDYFWFCQPHAREYNRSWDYFAGMKQNEYETMIRSSATWERPTWPLGGRGGDRSDWAYMAARAAVGAFMDDPDLGTRTLDEPERVAMRSRLKQADRQALATLELPETASLQDIKKRFKQLVKRYHPDATGPANKPSRAIEERLRNVIQAYSHLVDSGLYKDSVEEGR